MTGRTQGVAVIRAFEPQDGAAISALAKRAFQVHQAVFVVPEETGGDCITIDDRVVAAAMVRVIVLPSGRKIGFLAWLMTHPAYCGRGFARQLVAASTERLQAIGCDEIVTEVEGYNTGSANAFYQAGYRRISLWQQLLRWNPLDVLWLWLKMGLAFDPGHFLWVAAAVGPPHHPWQGRLAAVLFNTLLALFAFALGGGLLLAGPPLVPSLDAVGAFFLAVGSLLAVREIGMQAVAWWHQVPLEFRAWSGGWGVSLLIAMGFGNVFPLPGNVYPRGDGWSIRHYRAVLGQGAVLSTLLIACLVVFGSVLRETVADQFAGALAVALVMLGKPLLLFDTLVAVAPFEGFNGRHLRDYQRILWLACSALAVIVFVWA